MYMYVYFRERPSAIPVHVKSIDDTSNFDDFSDADIRWPGAREASKLRETGPGVSDLPWINYTFKVCKNNVKISFIRTEVSLSSFLNKSTDMVSIIVRLYDTFIRYAFIHDYH